MPKKKPGMTPEEQSEAFKAKVRELINAGDFDPEKAAATVERLVKKGDSAKRD